MRTVLTLTLAAALLQQIPSAPPPRDGAPASTAVREGTAVIRGRVYDRETGAALANISVTLVFDPAARPPEQRSSVPWPPPPRSTRTDGQGRYAFERLPAATYFVSSNPPEYKVTYLPQSYGMTRPANPTRPPARRPLPLTDGQVLENVDLPLWRSLAITGHVTDEFGEPLATVPVVASIAGSEQRAGFRGPYQITSDDRGVFRMFGMAPGRYVVCATPQNFGMRGGDDAPERFVKTCAPSATSEAEGQVVELTSGDYGDVEIRMMRGRAYKVTGVATDSQGKPVQQVSLARIEGNGFSSSGGQIEPSGRFTFNGLTAGDYTVVAQVGSYGAGPEAREREFAEMPLHVDTADIENLALVTAKGRTVPGRVVFEGAAPPTGATVRVMLRTMPGSALMMVGPSPAGEVKADQSFTLAGVFGTYGVGVVGLPSGWVVKSVRLGNDDVTDRPVQFQGDSRLEVVLSNRGSTLTGRALPGPGEQIADYRVMLFPADRERWNALATFSSTSPKPDGTYKLGPVRPGDYFVALVRVEDVPSPMTAATGYEKLSKTAQRVTLLDDETKDMELTIPR